MTAWSKNLEDAPKDRPILMRCPNWDAIAQVYWSEEGEFWCFSEQTLAAIAGGPDDDELENIEWCEIPE